LSLSRTSRFLLCAAAFPLAVAVSGCVDTVGQARVDPAAAPSRIARRDGVSPRGATVALASVDGAPQNVSDAFAASFNQAAPGLELTTVDAKTAAYLVRGYLTAYPGEAGSTRFAYVLDVFDRRKVRVARLTDDLPVKAAVADPWALADVKIVQALAERSAADLADALTNTAEAVAGAAVASAARPGETKVTQDGTSVAPRTVAETPETGRRLGLAATR
jgi:hypothetical protein